MKKKKCSYGLSLFFLGAALTLGACQKTPDEEYVHGKNSQVLESDIQKTTEAQESREEETAEISKPVFEEFSYQDQFSGAEETVQIQVDASGTWQTNQLPVIRVKPYEFTAKDVRRWGEVLTGSNIFYEPKVELTKTEIEELLLEWKQIYEDEDALLDYYMGDRKSAEDGKEQYLKYKAELESIYSNAPDTAVRKETDWQFQDAAYYERKDMLLSEPDEFPEQDQILKIEAETEEGFARIYASNYRDGNYHRHTMYYELYHTGQDEWRPEWDISRERPMTLSEEEVIQLAEKTVAELGLERMQLSSFKIYGAAQAGRPNHRDQLEPGTEEEIYRYILYFYPEYQGISVLQKGGFVVKTDDSYGAFYDFESLVVQVSNDTIQLIQWNGPLEVVEVEQQDIEVLPFADICESFRKQMQLEYTEGKISRYSQENSDYEEELERIKGGEIRINEILFGLIRIQIPNNYDEFRLVPAWSFRGDELLDWGDGIDWDGYDAGGYQYGEQIYQTINAVDGTFINWRKGY